MRPPSSQLLEDVRGFRAALLREEGEVCTVELASRLSLVGYGLSVRKALPGASGTSCFRNLSHEFLLVSLSDLVHSRPPLIVPSAPGPRLR